MPEMSEENYKAIMERLDKQDKLIEAQNKKLSDLAAMNKVLMQTTDEGGSSTPTAVRHKELEEKLKGGLKHA